MLGSDEIWRLRDAKTRSISAENPDGARAGGAQEVPGPDSPAAALGRGWKVRPAITIEPGATVTIADIAGPGIVQHIWITTPPDWPRALVLRIYWDGEGEPSVECPLGDFFGMTFGRRHPVSSLPAAVNSTGGLNSYWPMPFRGRCRITIENPSTEAAAGFFYQVTYSLEAVPGDAAYLHAQWRRAASDPAHPDHVIVDGIRGRGHYVGTVLSWIQQSHTGWWGEGELKFYLDGDEEFPTICGTGTEDYFGGAWGFYEGNYSTAFLGYPLRVEEEGGRVLHGLYRWHVPDPIRFEQDLRVTVQALGLGHDEQRGFHFVPLADDIASLALWYQAEPHAPFPELPGLEERRR